MLDPANQIPVGMMVHLFLSLSAIEHSHTFFSLQATARKCPTRVSCARVYSDGRALIVRQKSTTVRMSHVSTRVSVDRYFATTHVNVSAVVIRVVTVK